MNTTIEQHRHVSHNKSEIEQSEWCRCCYCKKDFLPTDIKEWVGKNGKTALCPYCGIDAVLGNQCGFELTDDLMETMYREWFS